MLFYRRTTKPDPISNWGHAMFADNIGGLGVYGSVTPQLADDLSKQLAVLWQQVA